MSKIVNHPTRDEIIKFASLPLMEFDRAEFTQYMAYSAHFAGCRECRELKNKIAVIVEKYQNFLSDFDCNSAERIQKFMDSEASNLNQSIDSCGRQARGADDAFADILRALDEADGIIEK